MKPMTDLPISPLRGKALPLGVDGDTSFAEPWEAKAFAIIVSLAQAGHFAWSEWVECLSREVAAAAALEAAGVVPKSYYEQWLDAAERLLVDKGVTSQEQLLARRFAIGTVGSTHVLK